MSDLKADLPKDKQTVLGLDIATVELGVEVPRGVIRARPPRAPPGRPVVFPGYRPPTFNYPARESAPRPRSSCAPAHPR